MAIAFFDLDKTLLAADSDYEWAFFLQRRNIITNPSFIKKIAQFDQDYNNGKLDMGAYCKMMISPLLSFSQVEINALLDAYIDSTIRPIIFPKAHSTILSHQQNGDEIAIVTATIDYVAKPIAKLLGIQHVLATTPIYENERLTGDIQVPPCYQYGKVTHVEQWLDQHNQSLCGSYFYSDSVNDIPLLNNVDHPVVVNPDAQLRVHAKERGWTLLNWTL